MASYRTTPTTPALPSKDSLLLKVARLLLETRNLFPDRDAKDALWAAIRKQHAARSLAVQALQALQVAVLKELLARNADADAKSVHVSNAAGRIRRRRRTSRRSRRRNKRQRRRRCC
jgi:hypothetical protein